MEQVGLSENDNAVFASLIYRTGSPGFVRFDSL